MRGPQPRHRRIDGRLHRPAGRRRHMGAGISGGDRRDDRGVSGLRGLLDGLQHRQPRRAFPGPHPFGTRCGRQLLPRLGAPVHLDPVGQRSTARGLRGGGRIPRRDEDRRRHVYVDQDRPPLRGLLLAQAAGELLEGRIEPLGVELHARTDALFVRGALRPVGA